MPVSTSSRTRTVWPTRFLIESDLREAAHKVARVVDDKRCGDKTPARVAMTAQALDIARNIVSKAPPVDAFPPWARPWEPFHLDESFVCPRAKQPPSFVVLLRSVLQIRDDDVDSIHTLGAGRDV
jgi:hypothetical protein